MLVCYLPGKVRMADNIDGDKLASLISDSSGYFLKILFHESIENMILNTFAS